MDKNIADLHLQPRDAVDCIHSKVEVSDQRELN